MNPLESAWIWLRDKEFALRMATRRAWYAHLVHRCQVCHRKLNAGHKMDCPMRWRK